MRIEEGKVILNIDGKDKKLDPSNADELLKLGEQAEKGYAFEKGQTRLKDVETELSKAKEVLDSWNNKLGYAMESEDGAKMLLSELKAQGIKLPGDERNDPPSDPESVVEKLTGTIKNLEKEIEDLKNEQNVMGNYLLSQHIGNEHASLEKKYTVENGYPIYNRQDVQKYAEENKISKMEDAYWSLNRDKIVEMQNERRIEKDRKQKQKIDKVASPNIKPGEMRPSKPKVYKSYSAATRDMLAQMAESGESFHTDD